MTNADCIRRMSDDQLYDFLSEWECGDIDYSITFCDLCKQGGNELNLDCDGCRKHWLQRDAVDVGGLMYWKRNTTFTADTPQTERRTDRDGDVWEWRGDAWYCIGQANTPQTDCEACELDGKADVCKICRTSNYEPQTDCGWGKPTTVSHREDKED